MENIPLERNEVKKRINVLEALESGNVEDIPVEDLPLDDAGFEERSRSARRSAIVVHHLS